MIWIILIALLPAAFLAALSVAAVMVTVTFTITVILGLIGVVVDGLRKVFATQ